MMNYDGDYSDEEDDFLSATAGQWSCRYRQSISLRYLSRSSIVLNSALSIVPTVVPAVGKPLLLQELQLHAALRGVLPEEGRGGPHRGSV